MALATTCPQCKTSFKVVPDQLKLRRGMVRCGVCQQVFSGIDFLRYVDDNARLTPEPPPVRAAQIDPPTTDLKTAFFLPETVFAPTTRLDGEQATAGPALMPASIQLRTADAPGAPAPHPDEEPATLPLQDDRDDLGLLDESADEDILIEAPGPAMRPAPLEADAIDYFAPERRAGGFSNRLLPVGWLVCGLLAATLLVQLIVAGRNWIGASLPNARPALTRMLAPLRLDLEPPRDLPSVTIESFELQSSGKPGVLTMSALLRNRAQHSVQWPAMELTLTDGQGALLVRKVILPGEYLAALPVAGADGLGPKAELPLRLALEARDVAPAGYSVTLFYP